MHLGIGCLGQLFSEANSCLTSGAIHHRPTTILRFCHYDRVEIQGCGRGVAVVRLASRLEDSEARQQNAVRHCASLGRDEAESSTAIPVDEAAAAALEVPQTEVADLKLGKHLDSRYLVECPPQRVHRVVERLGSRQGNFLLSSPCLREDSKLALEHSFVAPEPEVPVAGSSVAPEISPRGILLRHHPVLVGVAVICLEQ
jgi:hypothetical protein